MWREQREEAIVGELALQSFEANFLQYDVAIGIGKNFFMNAVASGGFRIDEFKRGDAGLEGFVFEVAMALFFGEVIAAVGYHETHVPSAGLVDARIINFVQDPV